MTVTEGMMVTVLINIDTGILPGNLTLMITDGTANFKEDYYVPSPLIAYPTEGRKGIMYPIFN